MLPVQNFGILDALRAHQLRWRRVQKPQPFVVRKSLVMTDSTAWACAPV